MKDNNNNVKRVFPVIGMGCSMCASRVEKALREIDGVEDVNVNLALANAEVTYDPDKCTAEIFQQAVTDAGYDMMID